MNIKKEKSRPLVVNVRDIDEDSGDLEPSLCTVKPLDDFEKWLCKTAAIIS